ncbi:ATP-binding protein [Glycomyces sp. L485]|uniref:ATP-binding protein n=1 Tax=Glycomyces sp. L485 TaxID=2909235 RepID=UPI001F4AD4E9|nr:ATP-binding protein [Glycomyces sp. L485]MCH7229937.1 ATP-binding protein [Glycomyces sp. L485]
MVATLESTVNHLVTGRRGVGKSTTLAVLQRRAEQAGAKVIFVDVEQHKSREYPDVLIEIIMDVLEAIQPKGWKKPQRLLRKKVKQLLVVLASLRDAGPEVTTSTESDATRTRDLGVTLYGGVARQFAKLSATAGATRSKRTRSSQTSTRTRRKEDFLRDLAPAISRALEDAAKLDGRKSLLVVLDDFYFIAKETQPLVLDHLHGISKRSNVWLKIGSVHSRTQSFIDGDPPLGMQPPHDLQHLSLDVGLADFATAKTFLEEVANGVLGPAGFRIRDVLTDTARERAVLVAGGAVARDYFDLLIAAADTGWEAAKRSDKNADSFTISAEHVQAAAGIRLQRKQTDLRNDAGREAPALEKRFDDLVRFVRDRDTFFFLVRRDHLDTPWGKEIVELEDLRFVHRIVTTRPNTGTWRGVDTVVFMVDFAALVEKRMRKAPVEFWKPGKSDELRRAEWVYDPNWAKESKKAAQRGLQEEDFEDVELPFED